MTKTPGLFCPGKDAAGYVEVEPGKQLTGCTETLTSRPVGSARQRFGQICLRPEQRQQPVTLLEPPRRREGEVSE